MFVEQEVEDGAQVLAVSWQWFQRLEKGEEAAIGRRGSKKVTIDGVNADGLSASTGVAMEGLSCGTERKEAERDGGNALGITGAEAMGAEATDLKEGTEEGA